MHLLDIFNFVSEHFALVTSWQCCKSDQ